MEPELLKTRGQIAGIAGIALGIVFLLYREVLRKAIFPQLDPADGYRLLRLITLLVWTLGLGGLAVWGWSADRATQVEARRGVAAGGDIQNTDIRIKSPPAIPPSEAQPSLDADVGAVGGAAAGGSISGSTIVFTCSKVVYRFGMSRLLELKNSQPLRRDESASATTQSVSSPSRRWPTTFNIWRNRGWGRYVIKTSVGGS